MSKLYKDNFLALHLNKFNSVEEFDRVLTDNGLTNIDPKAMFEMKNEGYTKVFFYTETGRMVGFCHNTLKKQVKFTDNFISQLRNQKSIDFIAEPTDLSIDTILDKISSKGIDSLNRYEKAFLENNSK